MPEQFKVGERVRFLRERREGVVQRILSPSRLEVLVDDFLEMEVDAADVVRIHSGEAALRKEDQPEEPAAKSKLPAVERSPTFVILRTRDQDYEFWLLNYSHRELLFTAYQRVHSKFKGLNANTCAPGEKKLFAKLTTQEFHMAQSVVIQLLQFPLGDKARPIPPLSLEIHCKEEVFGEQPRVIPEVGTEGWEFVLEEKTTPSIPEKVVAGPAPAKLPQEQMPEVVDLHIEQLVPDKKNLDALQMLRIQLEHFEKKITNAQMHKVKSMVFIHGSGSGKLRKEIHERLQRYPFVKDFNQADPLRYGNGATIVFF